MFTTLKIVNGLVAGFFNPNFQKLVCFLELAVSQKQNRGMKKSITYLLTYNFRHQHIGKMFNNNSKNRSPPTLTLLLHFRSAIFFQSRKLFGSSMLYYHNNNLQKCTSYWKPAFLILLLCRGRVKWS